MESSPFDIAIIGGGLIGLMLAAGLRQRNIKVTVYEQSSTRRAVGAGVGLHKWGVDAVAMLSTEARAVIEKVGTGVSGVGNVIYTNGPRRDANDASSDFCLPWQSEGGAAAHRMHLIQGLEGILPEGVLKLGHRLESIDDVAGGKVALRFTNGTEAQADVVIGCDGIKSSVRQMFVGDKPSAKAQYSHVSVYRALVPMEAAVAKLGEEIARIAHFQIGPETLLVTYPVAKGTMMHTSAFVYKEEGWTAEGTTVMADRAEVMEAYSAWDERTHAYISEFPAQLERWGVFDTVDHPLDTYTWGRVCIAGDAAHAMTPLLGSGITVGVQDSLALVALLEQAATRLRAAGAAGDTSSVLKKALAIYDGVRRGPSQHVAQMSRKAALVHTWTDPDAGKDLEKIKKALIDMFGDLRAFDTPGMVALCLEEFGDGQ